MSLAERFKKQADQVAERRAQLAYERAQAISKDVIESDQFKLALESGLDNMTATIDTILKKSCEAIFEPVADFYDTMRSKNLPEAYIRKWVHNFYDMIGPNDANVEVDYETRLKVVAEYMVEHPEMYNGVKDMSGDVVRAELERNSD